MNIRGFLTEHIGNEVRERLAGLRRINGFSENTEYETNVRAFKRPLGGRCYLRGELFVGN